MMKWAIFVKDLLYIICTNAVSLNPAQERCTWYNIMWSSLSDLQQVGGYFPVSSTNKTEILLKVVLNPITQPPIVLSYIWYLYAISACRH